MRETTPNTYFKALEIDFAKCPFGYYVIGVIAVIFLIVAGKGFGHAETPFFCMPLTVAAAVLPVRYGVFGIVRSFCRTARSCVFIPGANRTSLPFLSSLCPFP